MTLWDTEGIVKPDERFRNVPAYRGLKRVDSFSIVLYLHVQGFVYDPYAWRRLQLMSSIYRWNIIRQTGHLGDIAVFYKLRLSSSIT
jgi:hypothetical protein